MLGKAVTHAGLPHQHASIPADLLLPPTAPMKLPPGLSRQDETIKIHKFELLDDIQVLW